MTNRPAAGVIQHLLAGGPDGAGMSDGELLNRFLGERDEAALAALVRRHAPLVWGVCRRVLAHHHAEDAFQATFLVFVRKAATIRDTGLVANWLYGVARQTAVRLRGREAKRRVRESQAADVPEPAAGAGSDDLGAVLDEELGRLPAHYRAVVVLCHLEGKTRAEAARQLGVPDGSVASRLARARAMLARRLARRGVTLSAAAVAALCESAASAGAPASVVSSTITAAGPFAAGQAAAGLIPVNVAALTEGVLNAMWYSKLKSAGALVSLVLVVALGVALLRPGAAAEPPALGPGRESNKGEAVVQPKNVDGGLPPLTLMVGKRYQIYLSSGKAWPGEQSPVVVQKVFANGWVEVKTKEDQTAFLNLNHAVQIYPLEK